MVWQLRADEIRSEGGGERHALALRHLYRRIEVDDSWSVTLGKAARGWDFGYAAQPLDFLGDPRDVNDVEDRFHLRKASVFGGVDYASGNSTYGLVIGEYRQTGDNQPQVIATAETQFGATHVLAVAQKPEEQPPGIGAGFSTVVGQSLELHGSAFFRQGTARKIHRSLLDGRKTFYRKGDDPIADWRAASTRWFPRWVTGGQWTAESGLNVVTEWLHDESGLSRDQWSLLRDLADFHAAGASLGLPGDAIEGNLRNDARTLSLGGSMRDYVFLRLALPFGGMDGELRTLVNAADLSTSWGIRLTWPFGQGARLWLDASLNAGRTGTEFNEVPAARAAVLATSVNF